MAEVLINSYSTRLASAITAGAGAGSTFTVASGVPAVDVGSTTRLRVESEFILVTLTTTTQFTIVTRAVEDAIRFPAAAHAIGSPVAQVVTDEGLAQVTGVAAAIAAHEAAANPHSVYTTNSEAAMVADAQIAQHVALSDPHTQYTDSSEVSGMIAGHEAAFDPHPSYMKENANLISSSGQLIYNNAGAYAGAAALVYATTGANLTVTATGATVIPLVAKGTAGQSANIFEVQTSAGASGVIVAVSSTQLTVNGTLRVANPANGSQFSDIAYNGLSTSSSFTIVDSVFAASLIRLKAAVVLGWVPGTNLGASNDVALARNAAGVLEVNSGVAGTLRDLTLRNLHAGTDTVGSIGVDGSAAFKRFNTIHVYSMKIGGTTGDGTPGYIKVNTGADAIQIASSATVGVRLGTNMPVCWSSNPDTTAPDIALMRNAAGVLEVNNASGSLGTLRGLMLGNPSTTVAALQIRAIAGATNNLVEFQNTAGSTVYSQIDRNGWFGIGAAPSYPIHIVSTTHVPIWMQSNSSLYTGYWIINTSTTTQEWGFVVGGSGGAFGAAGTFVIRDGTGNANVFFIQKSTGNVGLGSGASVPAYPLYIVRDTHPQIVITNVTTNNTIKSGYMGAGHYASAEEPVATLLSYSEATKNNLWFGGGSSLLNAATEIIFYTAATTTTTNGTARLTIGSTGNVLIHGFTASTVGLTIRVAASQTANATTWLASDGTSVMAGVKANGRIHAGAVDPWRTDPGLYAASAAGDVVIGLSSNTVRMKMQSDGTNSYFGSESSHAFSFLTSNTVRLTLDTSGNLTVAEGGNLISGTTTGTKIGTAVTQKWSLYNATPIVQPSGAAQAALTNSTTGDTSGVDLVDVTTAAAADPVKCNNNFARVYTLLNAMRTAMVNFGSMKGAA